MTIEEKVSDKCFDHEGVFYAMKEKDVVTLIKEACAKQRMACYKGYFLADSCHEEKDAIINAPEPTWED